MRVAENWDFIEELLADERQPVADLTFKGVLKLLTKPRCLPHADIEVEPDGSPSHPYPLQGQRT